MANLALMAGLEQVFKGQIKVRLLPLGRLRSRKTKNPSLHPLKRKATTAVSRSRRRHCLRRVQIKASRRLLCRITSLGGTRRGLRHVKGGDRGRHRDQVFKGQIKVRLLPLGRLRSRKTKNPSLHPLKRKATTAIAVTHSPNHQRRTQHITSHRRHLGNTMATLGLRRPGEQVSTLTSGTCPPPGFPPNALRVTYTLNLLKGTFP
ncbi:hypothetical protein Taro_006754 [Colocasia esculenta]|uniref:Uncharacterized protein n=1 Tax=Colocasia esculenta TaxID=4460 RepID=A0A843TPL4_COLES|nr:hypothetical protein [Colocasia esculenta]